MIISCPECSGNVSDKALFCPHCGFPFQQTNILPNKENKPVKKANRTHPKLPNGFGSIRYKGKGRRNPYAVYPPVRRQDYDINGKVRLPKALGYYRTYGEAYKCLLLWNETKNQNYNAPTFSEIYEICFDKIYNSDCSESKINSYKAAYLYCKSLYKIPITNIYADQLQEVIDNCNKGSGTKRNIKIIFNMIFNYAIANNITQVNYSKFITVGGNDNIRGEPFTEEEINLLWEHSDNKDVQICLMYIYSGYRLSELKICDIDLDEMVFIGGVKNKTSKNRVVPIHPLIQDFVREFDQKKYNQNTFCSYKLTNVMDLCGIGLSPNGNKRTAHDFRHTFSWLCDKYGVDQKASRIIMGHTVGYDIHDNIYGHRNLEELRKEIEKIKRG